MCYRSIYSAFVLILIGKLNYYTYPSLKKLCSAGLEPDIIKITLYVVIKIKAYFLCGLVYFTSTCAYYPRKLLGEHKLRSNANSFLDTGEDCFP